MISVYRLERQGLGPFEVRFPHPKNHELSKYISSRKWYHDTSKNINFLKSENYYDFFYGCDSYDNLVKYFESRNKGSFDYLISMDYEIKKYDIDEKYVKFSENLEELAFLLKKCVQISSFNV